ncbi:Transposable element P transposase [Frankliniella fusca]|uniref:Transposable element P transposase n=1 Tax=Frankliniella fusca TaxID=407009 RepID=A0AAE1LUM3_9NEOP|nr:Transposable element P transposase [Frankliniella fusca]
MEDVSTRSSSSDLFADFIKDEEEQIVLPVIPPTAQPEEPCPASKLPDVPSKRKHPKNSRQRRVGPRRKKHKALRQKVEVLDMINEENEDISVQNVHQEQKDMQEQQVIHEVQDVNRDKSNNVLPTGKRKYVKRKGQVSAPRKYSNKEAKKEQPVHCDLDSTLDKSDLILDIPDGNDFEEHEFLFNSPDLQKTEALEILKQNLEGLLERSAWIIDISHGLCRLALLTKAPNIAVEKALVWNSAGKSTERVEIFIHNKPLPKPNFLWNIAQPDHDNLKLVAQYLSKLTTLLETVHVCEGVASYKNYWSSACENGLGEIEASIYNGNCHYRSVSCSLIVMESKSCSACGNDYMRFKRRKYKVTNARGKDALKINNRYLPKKLLIAKTEKLAAANKNLKKTVAQLRKRIQKLIKKDNALIDENLSKDFMKILKDNLHKMTPVQKLFWNEQVKAIAKQNVPKGVRWSQMMIKIALHLRMLSPTTYNFLQETGLLQLPSSRRLYDFTHYAEVKEGVQDAILDRLKEKLDKLKSDEHENFFNLLFDEMNIHSDLVITKSGEKSIQDLGDDLANVEGKKELAKKALV